MAATAKCVLKIFHQNLGKTPVKKLIFLSCRQGIYSFTKNKVIHRCSSRILITPSSDSFTDSHFQVGSFVKHLLWHQNYFDMDYPIQYFEDSIPPPPSPPPPICKWGIQTMQTLSETLDISSATVRVASDLLKALKILSDTTVRRSIVHPEDLKT